YNVRMIRLGSFRDYAMAMERVERRLRKVTAALDAARIDYAVVCGNAVAVWIAQKNPAATRTTKGVDLLIERDNLDQVSAVMGKLGFERVDLPRIVLFVDPEDPDPKSGVHLVWARMKVRPSYAHPAPAVDESVQSP